MKKEPKNIRTMGGRIEPRIMWKIKELNRTNLFEPVVKCCPLMSQVNFSTSSVDQIPEQKTSTTSPGMWSDISVS